VGGLLALATATTFDIDPGLTVGLGVAAALATQLGRTAARPVSTATTGGGGNPVVSFAEDGVSGALSITALVWPVVTAVLAVIVLVAVFLLWRKWREVRSRYRRPDLSAR
jgi:hypothetical protein